ncbi:hypothetical protein VB620_18510 [Nodularia harveyana UHCC-0300]|uniref:Uncharacterized protein n=1 Tax=Nodularia harveyana UHCC-0300 TaxID=2974287 RepID=A0ABU5UIJ3_9CYAN|nr:hypothetical protein [Nodularia harveyana]MEA5583325.1 hypothetical protein [Nodularia harveyana UHCC-0300]
MSEEQSIGVYFSANDKVYDWTIAFLNSFRTFNPDLRLILIPFNEECDRILQLQTQYNFEIYIDPSFPRLEAIGKAFELGYTPTGHYWFRRYAAFWGPLDRFMYLDARQVVLANLTPLITALDEFGFDFLHYDCAINQVYEPGQFRQQLLRQGRGRGFNSGRWASRKGLFSIEEFENLTAEALKIREQLNPRNTDQAFINYCCDMKPVVYGHFAEVIGDICQNCWARQSGHIYQESDKFYLWDYGGLDHKKQVILVHWAGYTWRDLLPHRWILMYFAKKNYNYLIFLIIYTLEFMFMLPKTIPKRIISKKYVNFYYHYIKRNYDK